MTKKTTAPAKKKTQEIPEPKNVHEAINMVMGRVGYVQKETKGLPYSFASEPAFIKAVRPHLVDVGLVVYQSNVELIERNEFTSKKGAAGINILAKFTWTWVHVISETSIEVTSFGEAADYGDKAANKAMTAAMKYNMRQTLVIETGDDPDYTDSKEFERAQEREGEDRKRGRKTTTTETNEEREPFTEPVGAKEWPPTKAENLRAALIAVKVLPPDAHNIHVVTLLDKSPFSIEVPTKDMVGWGKLYRGYKDETDDTDEAVRMATEAYGAGDPA